MKYSIDKLGATIVLTVESLLGEREDLSVFHAEILSLLAAGERSFLIDLCDSKRVSSIGIAALMEAVESVRRRQGDLKICHVSRQVDRVLTLLGMKQQLDVRGSRTEALRALSEVALRKAS